MIHRVHCVAVGGGYTYVYVYYITKERGKTHHLKSTFYFKMVIRNQHSYIVDRS